MKNKTSTVESKPLKSSTSGWIEIVQCVGTSILLLVITFPKILPGFSPKIDPQIHWAFNHLWIHDFQKTREIIFPHGPLTFLNYPLAMGDNLFWGVLMQILFRGAFIFSFLYLARLVKPGRWVLLLPISFFMLEFMKLDYILVGLAVNGVFISYCTQKNQGYVLALLAMTLGMYIKMSIGIMVLTILFSFVFLSIIEQQKPVKTLNLLLGIPLALLIGWLLMYGTLDGFINYFTGTLELVSGNSDVASTYPDNNWWYLGLSGASLVAIPLSTFWKGGIRENKKTWVVYMVLALCTFAVWKHSMAREDPWHIAKLFSWVLIFCSYLLVMNKQINWTTVVFSVLALFFFYKNINVAVHQFVHEVDLKGYQHFTKAFFQQKELFKKYETKSFNSIKAFTISEKDRAIIGEQTVDCYPINYAFIPVNNLNWQPRPVLQSYAAYTPWLDARNANHFNSEKAPQYLIWETDILQRDTWKAELMSIDNHYLLNDEPQTIIAILTNYSLISKGKGYLLLEKRSLPLDENRITKNTIESTWNEWIPVPDMKDGILLAQLRFKDKFLKKIKSKIYKDEPLFIEYQLENGEQRKHRISKRNAEQGLWINPFIYQPSTDFVNSVTAKIRFSTGTLSLVYDDLKVTWQSLKMNPTGNIEYRYEQAFKLFGKTIYPKDTILLTRNGIVENEQVLKPKQTSESISIPISKLTSDTSSTLFITTGVRAKMSSLAKGALVISVESKGENLLYKTVRIDNFMKIYHNWELGFLKENLPKTVPPNTIVKVYVWNFGREEFLVKDLKMIITRRQQ